MTKDNKSALLFAALVAMLLFSTPSMIDASEPPADASKTLADASKTLPEAEELLTCSIAFHDPEARWAAGAFEIQLDEKRPDGSGRKTHLTFDNAASRFEMDSQHYAKDSAEERRPHVQTKIVGDDVSARLNGKSDFTDEEAERYRLTPERALGMRNYYQYLYGLPMKLRDPGTHIEPAVKITKWQDQEAYEVKVTYDPEVGKDLWYFYFSLENCALIGYRFHHKVDESDGENIYLEGLAEVDGLRLPQHRTWYTVAENRLLGTDSIVD